MDFDIINVNHDYTKMRKVEMHRRNFLSLMAASLTLGSTVSLLTACGDKQRSAIPTGSTVLALGDSLTEGYGASLQTSYPTILASITGWKIINGGVSGDKSDDALKRLPALLAQYQPKLVLTSIGGNDILKRVPESTMRSNIISICELVKNSHAQNMLIAVPQFSILGAATGTLHDHSMYESIAKEMDIPLFSAGWSQILSDENLKSDAIHANEEGYRLFAEQLAKRLREVGYLA